MVESKISVPSEVAVFSLNADKCMAKVPRIFNTPVRPDLISFVHKNLRLNRRQPYAVDQMAGMRHSAKSWGTGRAMARVPRVKASGTRRGGQGARANFCRGGRMAARTNVFRRWNRKTPQGLRQYTAAMGVAASSDAALVMARGHLIENVEHVPIVVKDEKLEKTKDAMALLKKIGLDQEIKKVANSKTTRAGKGKMRNRRYVMKKGPLFVYQSDSPLVNSMKNISGIEVARVTDLSVLDLAPGGQAGRLVIWTEEAFNQLDEIFDGKNVPEEVAGENAEDMFYTENVQEFIKPARFIYKEEQHSLERNGYVEKLLG